MGASGDLTPLAHLALGLSSEIAEAQTAQVLAKWQGRDALAFVNGTAASTVICSYGLQKLKTLLNVNLELAFIHSELQGAYREPWSPKLAQIHPQQGHLRISEVLWQVSSSGDWFAAKGGVRKQAPFTEALAQDPYSIRCLPQLLGAVYDQCQGLRLQVELELHSISDNPSFFMETGEVVHGGNFNAQHLAFVADQAAIQLSYLSIYMEKRIAILCDPKRSFGLSPFARQGDAALNSGFMGAQVSATSLLAEIKSLQSALSLQTRATNNDNQDMVSMATLGAWRLYKMAQLAEKIAAIEVMLNLEALKQRTQNFPNRKWSDFSHIWQGHWRIKYDYLKADRPLFRDIERISSTLEEHHANQEMKLLL